MILPIPRPLYGLTLVLLLAGAAPARSADSALAISSTKCEGRAEPLGIGTPQPQLSWVIENPNAKDRGEKQTAYQVLVGSDLAHLAQDQGDMWDSGKITSEQSLYVPYSGSALNSDHLYYWKVRIWDRFGNPSSWSKPSTWSMGILSPDLWKAKWIGQNSEGSWKDYTVDVNFTLQKEAASIYFRAHGSDSAYLWQINAANGQPVLREHLFADGKVQVLKDVPLGSSLSSDDLSRPHTLEIKASGSTIETRLDDRTVDTMTDSHLTSGFVGFRESSSESAVFHSIKVKDNQGTTLLDEDFTQEKETRFTKGTLGPEGLTLTNDSSLLKSTGLRTPLLRHDFALAKDVRRAWIYASAEGIYEMHLNGKQVGDRYFAPGWTNYFDRIEYQTYDVTALVHQGANTVGAQLAPGWFLGNIAWFGPDHYGTLPALFAELHVEYTDGDREVISSDKTWKTSGGPVQAADYMNGEEYDASKEQPGWDSPGFNDAAWTNVDEVQTPDGKLVSQIDPPIRVHQEFTPTEVTEPKPGVYLYKLPQNITGVARVKAKGTAGSKLTLRYGEILNSDGTINFITAQTPNLPFHAENTDTYTFAKDGEATFQPHFTWRGFQYIEVSGVTDKPDLTDVAGISIGTDVPQIGELKTSSDFLNQLESNLRWSGLDAYMSFPMDCPQRTERLGWTGDANFFLASATYFFDMSNFYTKWETDMTDSQAPSGKMPNLAPTMNRVPDEGGCGGGWGDASVCVPYELWKSYGDTEAVEEGYSANAKWLDFLQRQSANFIVPDNIAPAGDWQSQDEHTPNEVIATAYFAYDAKLEAEMANALGKKDDADKYQHLFDSIKAAFASKFIQSDGTVSTSSQTDYVLALHIGLISDDLRPAAQRKLADDVARHQNHLTTGFVGTQWLLGTLTEMGRADLAYAILQQQTKPSWGYMIAHHATTIWESWNIVNDDGTIDKPPYSLNHSALGSCGAWMYRSIGGIAQDPSSTAFKQIVVHPRIGGGLTDASAKYDSPYGAIATHWHLENGRLDLEATIPVNTTAKIYLPTQNADSISEEINPAAFHQDIQSGMENGNAVLTVGSGSYHFTTSVLNLNNPVQN